MVRYNNNRGGWIFEEIENRRFLRYTHIFYIFIWTVMLPIHLPMNSGSVESTS